MLISRLLKLFFHWLYHPFAFAYDFVAAAVSFGHWNDWVQTVIPMIEGTRVLELGYGPGHLQRSLQRLNLLAVGLDESPQMSRLAARRLRNAPAKVNLTRGLAQNLPFPAATFDTIVSTFPSGYIVDVDTLSEVKRTLRNGGRLIVLMAAWPKNPFLGWLFRVTHESPSETMELLESKLKEPFLEANLEIEVRAFDVQSGRLLTVIAQN